MAETQLQTSKTNLIAGKVIADTTFSDRGDQESAVFPLNYRNDYSGKVVFSVIEEEETNIDEIRDAVRVEKEAIAARDNSLDERGEPVKKSTQQQNQELKDKTQARAQGNRPSTVNSSAQKKDPPAALKSATLFLPQSITFADGVQYENVDLGAIGGLAQQGAQGALGGDGFIGSMGGGIQSIMDSFKGGTSAGAGRLAANAVSNVFGSAGSAGVRAATRVTMNPNTRALFKSVNMRAFTFTFKMIPLSLEESLEIQKVIKFFRTELYPEQILLGEEQDKEGQVPLGYRFPNKILIEMFYNEKNVATKILPCYLESMQTVYNPSSMGMHADGSFQEVDISLNFREARTLSRDDIVSGGY
jgi:hypothetical protein